MNNKNQRINGKTPRTGDRGLSPVIAGANNKPYLPRTPGKVTPELMNRFLIILANNGGIISDAADQVGVSRVSLHRKRIQDTEFARLWEIATDLGIEVLEDELKRRGLDGVDKPIFHQGEIVGWVKEKSDYCLGLVLRAHKSKYKDGPNVNVGVMVGGSDNKYAGLSRSEKLAALSHKVRIIHSQENMNEIVSNSHIGSIPLEEGE